MTDTQDQPSPQLPLEQPPAPPPPEAAKSMFSRRFWLTLGLTTLLLVLLVLPPALVAYWGFAPGYITANKTLVIPRGTHVQEIGQMLQANDIVANALVFKLLCRSLAPGGLHAGEYLYTPEQSMADMILMMRDGKSIVHRFTVPEGLMTSEIIAMIESEPALSGTISVHPAEGSLWPETYHFSYGDSRNGLIERMQKPAKEELKNLWEKRAPDLPLASPEEALIMASIIEKETGKKAEERPKVAGVFYNRLKTGMRLQSDPTVIYALTGGKAPLARDLTHQDLETSSPYNTYMTGGLPPGPICNPGAASLQAALHPENHDFLYFVADGSGGHAFAKDLPTHNKNVSNWLKAMRAQ